MGKGKGDRSKRSQAQDRVGTRDGVVRGVVKDRERSERVAGAGKQAPAAARDASVEGVVRARISELVSSGGLPQGTLTMYCLYLLPDEFVAEYEALFSRALVEKKPTQSKVPDSATGEVDGPVTRPGRQVRTSPKTPRQVGGVQGAPKTVQKHWFVRDPKAFELKKKIDRKLRGLAREMRGAKTINMATKCDGCARFLETGWSYCPHCGSKVSTAR